LGDLLRRSTEVANVSPGSQYQEITVRLWGKGVVRRGTVAAEDIDGSRRFLARSGQFIVSRIDARNGALGIVPDSLDGALVTNDFPVFVIEQSLLDSTFFEWLTRTRSFVELCQRASEGTTNRVRLNEARFLALEIPLPPPVDQQRIVARINAAASKLDQIANVRSEIGDAERSLLGSAFQRIVKAAPRRPFRDVAPLMRRRVNVRLDRDYLELGIRSFGRGAFHKPALPGADVGSKKLFEIHPGDLVFSNVFAWEGALAVARDADAGRFGSHRFITCVPHAGVSTAPFLRFYFLTNEGLAELGTASPGGAGRNRTLGLNALGAIQVPVPPYEQQLAFDTLQMKVDAAQRVQSVADSQLDALLPSILDRAFKGEL